MTDPLGERVHIVWPHPQRTLEDSLGNYLRIDLALSFQDVPIDLVGNLYLATLWFDQLGKMCPVLQFLSVGDDRPLGNLKVSLDQSLIDQVRGSLMSSLVPMTNNMSFSLIVSVSNAIIDPNTLSD